MPDHLTEGALRALTLTIVAFVTLALAGMVQHASVRASRGELPTLPAPVDPEFTLRGAMP